MMFVGIQKTRTIHLLKWRRGAIVYAYDQHDALVCFWGHRLRRARVQGRLGTYRPDSAGSLGKSSDNFVSASLAHFPMSGNNLFAIDFDVSVHNKLSRLSGTTCEQ